MTEIIKLKANGTEIFGLYKQDYNEYDKEDFYQWLAERNECKVEDITEEQLSIDEDAENIEVYFCDECERLEVYEFKGDERKELNKYISYGNPEKKLIQSILPDMQPWLRETYIRGSMGCICPTCMKMIHG